MVILILNIASLVVPSKVMAQEPVNDQVFYDELSPYGEWVQNPNYGYIWIPNAGPYFSPYQTAGHWAYTNYGWTWVSDYPWGWAPFHYGRWDRDPNFGWFWVPGHEWGPAWVTWRQCDGYYGWAPIAPGISIEYAYGNEYYPSQDRWVFVNQRYICDPYVYNYYAPRSYYGGYIQRTTVIYTRYDDHDRGYYYNQGPRVEEVERVTNRRVDRYEVRNNDRPGQYNNGNTISLYRPVVNRTADSRGAQVAPRNVTDRSQIKTESQRPNASENIRNNPGQYYNKQGNSSINGRQEPANIQKGNTQQIQHEKPVQQPMGTHPGNINPTTKNIQQKPANTGKPEQKNIKPASPVNSEKGRPQEPEKKAEEGQRNPR